MQTITALTGATFRAAAFLTRLSISCRHFEGHGRMASVQSPEKPAVGNPLTDAGNAVAPAATALGEEKPLPDEPAPYRLGDDAHAFPLVGLIAAAPAALLLLVLPALGLSPLACGILALAALVAMTGALHEDGLADVADGLGGHHRRERALDIMHDSRVGSYGAIALVLSLGLRAALLAELCAARPLAAALALLAASAASRGAMAAFWGRTPPATGTGLAARAGQPARDKAMASLAIGAAMAVGLALPFASLPSVAAAIALPALALLLFRSFVIRRIGGQTGDCLGAAQQLCEIAVLIGLAMGA
ncbi:adenosylcobinamide-GDP ribazoletransferase [Aurantimonas sp. 22II-16-19i]|uniref:adenosylcobinamide-GDP ribazoletransferase n=1 Tax=Aurantimonas sp. 22II-16-19i TaxID=1317114 RepID=UPI001FD8D0C0|nr:adenosylcobinamide-GDP ribazoletransferase [Aurantimonas sp. 22II-16-19i]